MLEFQHVRLTTDDQVSEYSFSTTLDEDNRIDNEFKTEKQYTHKKTHTHKTNCITN